MLNLVQQGGIVMWLILLGSIVGVVLFFDRLYHFRRAHLHSDDFLEGIYNNLNRKNIVEAVHICDNTPGPAAKIVKAAIVQHEESPETIRSAIVEAGLAEIPRMERFLNLIGTLGHAVPLLGLLGTVIGMMDVFLMMHQTSPLVHAGDLASGMWKALITTAAGIAVGLVLQVLHNFLVNILQSLVLDMERTAVKIYSFLTQDHGTVAFSEIEASAARNV